MITPGIHLAIAHRCHLRKVSYSYKFYALRSLKLNLKILAVQNEDSCNPSPCGTNAICQNGAWSCPPEYHGDPFVNCHPECVYSSDCSRNLACIKQKCIDPCASNALCTVNNHIAVCSCPVHMTGNPFVVSLPLKSNFD